MSIICPVCGDGVEDDGFFIADLGEFENAVAETRYGNLDEALIRLARAIPALDGLPPLVARELARRECGRTDA